MVAQVFTIQFAAPSECRDELKADLLAVIERHGGHHITGLVDEIPLELAKLNLSDSTITHQLAVADLSSPAKIAQFDFQSLLDVLKGSYLATRLVIRALAHPDHGLVLTDVTVAADQQIELLDIHCNTYRALRGRGYTSLAAVAALDAQDICAITQSGPRLRGSKPP